MYLSDKANNVVVCFNGLECAELLTYTTLAQNLISIVSTVVLSHGTDLLLCATWPMVSAPTRVGPGGRCGWQGVRAVSQPPPLFLTSPLTKTLPSHNSHSFWMKMSRHYDASIVGHHMRWWSRTEPPLEQPLRSNKAFLIGAFFQPSKQDTLTQYWCNVGVASQTVPQHYSSVRLMYCDSWEVIDDPSAPGEGPLTFWGSHLI